VNATDVSLTDKPGFDQISTEQLDDQISTEQLDGRPLK
jgi:hypothetical protein